MSEYDPKQFDLLKDGTPARPPKPNRVLVCGCEQAEQVQENSGYILWQTTKSCDEHKVGP